MNLYGPRTICIGDSITFDTIAPTEGAYRYYLWSTLSKAIRSNVYWVGENSAAGILNAGNRMCGASSQRIDEINSTYDPGGQITRQRADLAICHLGTNDMTQLNSGAWSGGSVAISVSNLSTLLDTSFAANPNLVFVACKIIPNTVAGADTNITAWNTAAAAMIAAHSFASRIIIADCNAAFKANATWSTDYMGDGTHPNSAGKAVIASTIVSAVQSGLTLMPRTTGGPRVAIKPFVASLNYAASTATTLGAGNTTLDTTLPWAVSFWMNLSTGQHLATNQGILCLRTDQATPFVFLSLRGTANRGFEFGSSANFLRMFPNVSIVPNAFFLYSSGWHEITVTFDGVSRTTATSYRLYIDGNNIAVSGGTGLGASTNQNAIGAAVAAGVAGTFRMAQLRIWNGGTAMTAQQAADHYFNHLLPTGPTLIRNYNHEDAAGTTLTDSTGNQAGAIGTATWNLTDVPNKARTAGAARTVISTTRTVAA